MGETPTSNPENSRERLSALRERTAAGIVPDAAEAAAGIEAATKEAKGDNVDRAMNSLEKAMKGLEKFFEKISDRLAQFGSGTLKRIAALFKNTLDGNFLLDIAKRPATQFKHIQKTFEEKGLTLKESTEADPNAAKRGMEQHLGTMSRNADAIQKHRGQPYEFEQMVVDAIGVETGKTEYKLSELAVKSTEYKDNILATEKAASPEAAAAALEAAKKDLFGITGLKQFGKLAIPKEKQNQLTVQKDGRPFATVHGVAIEVPDKKLMTMSIEGIAPTIELMAINDKDPAELLVIFNNSADNVPLKSIVEKARMTAGEQTINLPSGKILKLTIA